VTPAGRLSVLVVGDPYFDCAAFERGLASLADIADLSYHQIPDTSVRAPKTKSESRLREFAGDPSEIAHLTSGHDILVVHGAAVSDEVLSTPGLRLVSCVRGGPVNVDVTAATGKGVLVCNSPGKNAASVAELTIAFTLILQRGIMSSQAALRTKGMSLSAFDGAEYFGVESASSVMGLVGFGFVGYEVARRAQALGIDVVAYDPYVTIDLESGVRQVELAELLEASDVVSLHARQAPNAPPMFGAAQFGAMKSGAFFINTAREQFVDEDALLAALDSGRIAGAALDVVNATSGTNPLVLHPRVVVTPHIGGATRQTLDRGSAMATESIRAFHRGHIPPYAVNPQVWSGAPAVMGRPK
jgi:D-3-phosphoglycerate dehydrogenase